MFCKILQIVSYLKSLNEDVWVFLIVFLFLGQFDKESTLY